MIVCRKPVTLYDVDVIGLSILAVIGAMTYFCVIRPAGANAHEYTALSESVAEARTGTERTSEQLRGVNHKIEQLRNGVNDRVQAAPKPGALTPFLQRVANLALQYDLELNQVVPSPVQPADGYLVNEIAFIGRGQSLDFARLLESLAWENPYFSLQDFSIRGGAGGANSKCEVAWTLRLYMLDSAATIASTSQISANGERP